MNIKQFWAACVLGTMVASTVSAWDAADSAACNALAERLERGFEDTLRYEERHRSQFNYKGWELWSIQCPAMLRNVAATGDVNAGSPAGFTALQVACYYADVELVKALIEAGAEVNLRPMGWEGYGFPGDTPVALCVRGMTAETARARVEIVKMLLANGADPDADMTDWVWGGSSRVTPFCYLNGEPYNNAMRLALLQGVSRSIATRARTWDLAWQWYSAEVIRVLLEGGISPNRGVGEKGATLLYWLVRMGEPDLVQLAINKGADVKASDTMKKYLGDYLFAIPAGENDSPETAVKIAEILVKAKANLKSRFDGASLYAYYIRHNTPAARALLKFFAGKGIRH
ncbi:MAG: hypothetical protein E7033_02185 [Akkermansiaceae bacterium]|nr:hypothetical protein [Akkermansiaceae bacterium]